jgi:hypothetical protein
MAGIKAAQAAPQANYMLYAELVRDTGAVQYPLETVRLPQTGLNPSVVAERLETRARNMMRDLGFEGQEIGAAQFLLGYLPDDVVPVLDGLVRQMQAGGSDLALLDFLYWEAAKLALHQTPKFVGSEDEELVYMGLRLRRSGAS